jgi:hypothetical protein
MEAEPTSLQWQNLTKTISFIIGSTLVYLCLDAFFILIALRSILTTQWALIFIPVWIAIAVYYVVLGIFAGLDNLFLKRRSFNQYYLWQALLLTVALIQAIIVIINLNPERLYPYPISYSYRWMLVMIPTFVTLGLVWVALLVHQVITIYIVSKAGIPGIIVRKVLWALSYLFAVFTLLVAAITLGLSGDYSPPVFADDSFVPLWILEICIGIVCIVQIVIQVRAKRFKEVVSYVFFFLFALALAINQIIVFLNNSANAPTTLPFTWFSSLLPLTVAYVYSLIWAFGIAEIPSTHEEGLIPQAVQNQNIEESQQELEAPQVE